MRSSSTLWRVTLVAAVIAAACASSHSGLSPASVSRFPPVAPPVAAVDSAYALAGKVLLPVRRAEESEGLLNVFHLSDHVISGSEPSGDAAFEQLAAMGVKTIVSVDGKTPDVERAKQHGLRYVHIPIEYRGISDEELLQLAKTYRDCDGPFYAHCFHGMHRGPSAAAVGRLVLDGAPREQVIAEMRQWCGTAQEYEGLFRDLATKPIPSEDDTRAFLFDFPAARGFTGFREAMVDVSRRHDALKKLLAHDFTADRAHPDVDSVNEATQLAATFALSGTLAEVHDRPADFQGWLAKEAAESKDLVDLLTAYRAGDGAALDASKKSFAAITKGCADCHTVYRNR